MTQLIRHSLNNGSIQQGRFLIKILYQWKGYNDQQFMRVSKQRLTKSSINMLLLKLRFSMVLMLALLNQ